MSYAPFSYIPIRINDETNRERILLLKNSDELQAAS